MVLNLPAHHSECVVACMVIYMYSAEPGGATSWHPLLVGIIIDHYSSSCLTDTLFTVKNKVQMRYLKYVRHATEPGAKISQPGSQLKKRAEALTPTGGV